MNDSARWSERQRQMLAEMGIRLWQAPRTEPAAAAAALPERAPAGTTGRPGQPVSPLADVPAAAGTVPGATTRPRPMPSAPAVRAPESTPPGSGAVVEGRRPGGIDQMDWPALREAVANCQACGLCQSRRHTVFGVGHERAHWMLVGEAPGEQEDLRGEPFVGKAGQLLDNMLAAIGLTRSEAPAEQQVFIANVLKCRPPRNRDPQPAEVAQCEPFLERQLELVQPRLVLAMGRFAVQSLLKTEEPIGRLRGRVHRYHGRPLVVTYHPAYLLRNPTDKARAWEDLCFALEVMRGEAAVG